MKINLFSEINLVIINIKKEIYFCLPLEILLKPELFTGENKILCELCDKKFNAMKYLSFCNYPRK